MFGKKEQKVEDKNYILKITHEQRGIIVNALNEFRNALIKEEKDYDIVTEVLLKVLDAPEKSRFYSEKDKER